MYSGRRKKTRRRKAHFVRATLLRDGKEARSGAKSLKTVRVADREAQIFKETVNGFTGSELGSLFPLPFPA